MKLGTNVLKKHGFTKMEAKFSWQSMKSLDEKYEWIDIDNLTVAKLESSRYSAAYGSTIKSAELTGLLIVAKDKDKKLYAILTEKGKKALNKYREREKVKAREKIKELIVKIKKDISGFEVTPIKDWEKEYIITDIIEQYSKLGVEISDPKLEQNYIDTFQIIKATENLTIESLKDILLFIS